jgi:hypothetical protein
MKRYLPIKEPVSIHGVPIHSVSSYSLCGDPMVANVYYVGDMYQVETCRGSHSDSEFFIHLKDAIAYAETV